MAEPEQALRALPGIVDARVVEVAGSGPDAPARRVACLAGPGALSPVPDELLRSFRLDQVTPVTRLGETATLAGLPLWDEPALARVAAGLATRNGVADVAVASLPRSAPRFLPRALLVPQPGVGGAAEAPAEAAAGRSVLGARLSGRDALAEGRALTWPEGHPRTLGEALGQAARGDRGLVYVGGSPAGDADPCAPDGERRESYAELRRRALSILGGLRAAGARAGDVVLLDSGDAAAFVGAFWACVLGNLVAAPLAVPEADADPAALQRLRAVWELLGHPLLLTRQATAAGLAAQAEAQDMAICDIARLADSAPAEASPADDPEATAVVILTSGSTGTPKGVRQCHRAILSMCAAAVASAGLRREQEVFLNWMPLDHVGGFVFLQCVPAILACDQVHVPTAPLLADPLRWPELMSRHRVSVSWAPNFAFGMIADAVAAAPAAGGPPAWDLSRLRALYNGGEAVTESALVDFVEGLAPWGLPRNALRPSFGMSETCAPVTLAEVGHARGPFASLGPPVPGSALRILDEGGRLLREGEIGRLEIRGPQLFAGYHGRDDLTAAAVRDGWFDTGDVGFLADGQLYLTGRIKDSINVNGAKFFAHEIEAVAARTPGVERASLVAVPVRPGSARTDQVALFFSAALAPGGLDDDVLRSLLTALRSRLAKELGLAVDHLLPIPAEEIPRTSIGKIVRKTLQERFEAGAYAGLQARVAALLGGPGCCAVSLHRKVWVAQPLAPRPGAGAAVRLLFASDPAGLEALAPSARGERLRVVRADRQEHGARPPAGAPRQLAPDDAAGHAALLAEAGPRATVVHLWARERGDEGAYRSLLALARATAALPPERRPASVLVVAAGTDCLAAGDGLAEGASLLPGLVRSLALELPDVRWRLVDLPAAETRDLAGVLDRELAAGAEPEAAWRDGRRYVARFERVLPEPPQDGEPPVRPGSLWLVTGGLGGLGRRAASRLLGQGAQLLLVGRSEPGQLSRDAAEALAKLEALGPVRYAAVDVGDADGLARAVAESEAQADAPLEGILHLAGLGHPVPLGEEDGSGLPALRRAALDGLESLRRLLAARPDARLAVAGSIAGRVGGRIAGYAAVNGAAAEAAAALIAAGGRVSYLAFSAWSGVGMSEGRTSEALLRADGLLPLDEDTGLLALEAALWRPGSHWLVGLEEDHPLHAALVLGEPLPLTRPVAWLAGDGAAGALGAELRPDALGRPAWVLLTSVAELPRRADGAPDLDRLAAGDLGQRRDPHDETERRVAQIFAEVLSLENPAMDQDFFLSGGTSLLATRLAARLSRRFFVELPVGAIFRDPTVEGLTRQLRAREPKPGMVDSVARQLAVVESLSPDERAALESSLAVR